MKEIFKQILKGCNHTFRLPCWLSDKESACNAGDESLIPGSGRSSGGGNGNPLQYSCLENPMNGGAWQGTVHWVAKSWTQLSDFYFHIMSLSFLCIPLEVWGVSGPWCTENGAHCMDRLCLYDSGHLGLDRRHQRNVSHR